MKAQFSALLAACRHLLRRERIVGAWRALPAQCADFANAVVRSVQPDRISGHREEGSPPPGLRGPCLSGARGCAGIKVGRNRACGKPQPAFTVCVLAWRWHLLWEISPFAPGPAAPLLFGLAAVALALVPAAPGWALGAAFLSLLAGCLHFRSPHPDKRLVVAGLALALAASLFALAGPSATRAPGTPPDILSTRLLKARNAWFTLNKDDSAWFCAEIENVSRKTVSGFRGEVSLRDGAGAHLHDERVEHLEPLPPGGSFFFFKLYTNRSLGLVENVYTAATKDDLIRKVYDLDDTPQDLLEVRVEAIHKRFEQARHRGPIEFICTDVSTE